MTLSDIIVDSTTNLGLLPDEVKATIWYSIDSFLVSHNLIKPGEFANNVVDPSLEWCGQFSMKSIYIALSFNPSLSDLISKSFFWEISKQGHRYWENVAQSTLAQLTNVFSIPVVQPIAEFKKRIQL